MRSRECSLVSHAMRDTLLGNPSGPGGLLRLRVGCLSAGMMR